MRISKILTLIIGVLALFIALKMTMVLELMLYSYAFMVSGLFIPVLGAIFLKRRSPFAAILAMILGGGTTLSLIVLNNYFGLKLPLGLDANIFGIIASLLIYSIIHFIKLKTQKI